MKKIILIFLAVLNLGVPVFALVQIAKFSFRIFTPFELIMLIVLIIISIHANSVIFRKYIFKRKTKSIAIPENSDSQEEATPLDKMKSNRRLIHAVFALYSLIAVTLPAFYFSNTIYVFMNANNVDIVKIVEQVVHFKPKIEDIYTIYKLECQQKQPEDFNPNSYLCTLIESESIDYYPIWQRRFTGPFSSLGFYPNEFRESELRVRKMGNQILFIQTINNSIIALYNLKTKTWRFKTCSEDEADNYLNSEYEVQLPDN